MVTTAVDSRSLTRPHDNVVACPTGDEPTTPPQSAPFGPRPERNLSDDHFGGYPLWTSTSRVEHERLGAGEEVDPYMLDTEHLPRPLITE
jgi:hypothetical protein